LVFVVSSFNRHVYVVTLCRDIDTNLITSIDKDTLAFFPVLLQL
jgi:hypothetical protein